MVDRTVTLLYGRDTRIDVEPLPPRPLLTEFAEANKIDGKPYISLGWVNKRALMRKGYEVSPNDCPPIRNLNSYGFEIQASGNSRVLRHSLPQSRSVSDDRATVGLFSHFGDRHKGTDSGFLTSWLANAPYIKIVTGLIVYCPVGYGLYQGPIPYQSKDPGFGALAAIEYGNSEGISIINGCRYFRVEMNVVASSHKRSVRISRGDPIGVCYPVMPRSAFQLKEVNE